MVNYTRKPRLLACHHYSDWHNVLFILHEDYNATRHSDMSHGCNDDLKAPATSTYPLSEPPATTSTDTTWLDEGLHGLQLDGKHC
eukprot:4509815-Amphidinium_carterae.1